MGAMKDLTDGSSECSVNAADPTLREELYKRQRISHQNVVQFHGACVDPGHVSVFYEYCAKGSLMAVLQNTHYALDDMFRFALATDLCSGMGFIHESVGAQDFRLWPRSPGPLGSRIVGPVPPERRQAPVDGAGAHWYGQLEPRRHVEGG